MMQGENVVKLNEIYLRSAQGSVCHSIISDLPSASSDHLKKVSALEPT
jgi:hypothetical protein